MKYGGTNRPGHARDQSSTGPIDTSSWLSCTDFGRAAEPGAEENVLKDCRAVLLARPEETGEQVPGTVGDISTYAPTGKLS